VPGPVHAELAVLVMDPELDRSMPWLSAVLSLR